MQVAQLKVPVILKSLLQLLTLGDSGLVRWPGRGSNLAFLFPFAIHDGYKLTLLETVVLEDSGAKVEELLAIRLNVQAILWREVHSEQNLEVG